MADCLEPTTRFNNKTEDSMVLTMEVENDGQKPMVIYQKPMVIYQKRIKSGESVDINYRKGIDHIGLPVHFWVLPENRDVLREHPNPIFPAQVYDFADIDISYKSSDGSVTAMDFQFQEGTITGRIGLVRYATALYDSVKTAFGNCCFAAHVPSEGDAAGHASAPTNQAPGRLAPAPVSDFRINISSADQVAPPTSPSEIELATNNSHVPNLGVTAGHTSGLGVAPDLDPAPLVVGDAPGPVTAPIQAPPALEGAPGPDHIEAPPALGEGPSSASASGPSTSLNMVEALGQAYPALGEAPGQALYPTEAITPAPALHVDIPSAAQVAAPATPSEILVTN